MVAIVPGRPVIDPTNANLSIHAACGETVTFQVQDATGAFVDISAWALNLIIEGQSPVALLAGSDATRRLAVFSNEAIAQLPLNSPTPFVIRDDGVSPSLARWAGLINLYGFKAS